MPSSGRRLRRWRARTARRRRRSRASGSASARRSRVQRALLRRGQVVEPRMQAAKALVVRRQHQHVVGHLALAAWPARRASRPSGRRRARSGSTETLDEMRGSTWSPEISSFSSGQYRQACSGEWPVPTMTRQSCSRRCASSSPSLHAPVAVGQGVDALAEVAEAGAVVLDRRRRSSRRGGRSRSRRRGASRPVSATSTRQVRYSSRVIHSRHVELARQPAGHADVVGVHVGDEDARQRALRRRASANSSRQAASGLVGAHAGVDDGPAVAVVDAPTG